MMFKRQLDAALRREKQRQIAVVANAVLQLQQQVVDRTPIDSGQARANWLVEINGCSGSVRQETDLGNLKQAAAAVQAALSANPSAIRYLCLYNNLPYIRHLEYGLYPDPPKRQSGKTIGGFSTQAPQGMFRLALRRYRRILAQQGNRKT